MENLSVKNYNFRLLIWVLILNVIGIFAINSATGGDTGLVTRQIVGICTGIVLAGVISFIPYDKYMKLYLFVYAGCIGFLLMVLFLGLARGVARRWIVLPVIGKLQPSEFVKIGLIVFFAQFIGKNEEKLNDWKTILQMALFAAAPILLIFLEPDLSTSIIIAVTLVAVIYVGGLSYKIIGIVSAVVIPLGYVILTLIRKGVFTFLSEYQTNRILAFFDNTGSYTDQQLQQKNSVMAIASGRLTGKGLNNNSLSSIKNGNFLSEEQTDFIFAVIGEELGFIGCLLVIILYALIVFECFRMARRAEDIRARIICAGVGTLIAFQSFTNIAVTTGILPNTGLTLPFVSYGLSSLLSFYIGLGLVLGVGVTGDRPLARRY